MAPEKVYTRRGDDGTTSHLFGGTSRVDKDSPRIAACGDIDETVAALGMARAIEDNSEIAELMLRLQRELFVVGAEVGTDPDSADRGVAGVSVVTQEMVVALENEIDRLTKAIGGEWDFVVPGNTHAGAAIDFAVRVARRAERSVTALSKLSEVSNDLRQYVNRLSDLIWVIARYAEKSAAQPRPRE